MQGFFYRGKTKRCQRGFWSGLFYFKELGKKSIMRRQQFQARNPADVAMTVCHVITVKQEAVNELLRFLCLQIKSNASERHKIRLRCLCPVLRKILKGLDGCVVLTLNVLQKKPGKCTSEVPVKGFNLTLNLKQRNLRTNSKLLKLLLLRNNLDTC